jgi:rhodanese-related sulfurtransferase
MTRIRFITLEELMEMKENEDDFILVEVLSEQQYNEGHIPEAINIPVTEIEEEAEKHFDKDDKIVVYCSSYTCHASLRATRKLLEMGFEKTVDFIGGKREWRHADFDIEK